VRRRVGIAVVAALVAGAAAVVVILTTGASSASRFRAPGGIADVTTRIARANAPVQPTRRSSRAADHPNAGSDPPSVQVPPGTDGSPRQDVPGWASSRIHVVPWSRSWESTEAGPGARSIAPVEIR
jgi:hypothetical protein